MSPEEWGDKLRDLIREVLTDGKSVYGFENDRYFPNAGPAWGWIEVQDDDGVAEVIEWVNP